MNDIYNHQFYVNRDNDTRYAASKILSLVDGLFKISSVVDVGCGVGTWLKMMKNIAFGRGENIVIDGYDGDYVRDYLVINEDSFHGVDLEKRIVIKKKYDLCISLEVAEHLSQKRADSFVEDLCKMSDVILFSAATKYQGGDSHINEQRLDYWIIKFQNNGYKCIDCIRDKIWNDENIQFWYKQNIVIFINSSKKPILLNEEERGTLSVIHPDLFEEREEVRLLEEAKWNIFKRYTKLKFMGLVKEWVSKNLEHRYLIYGLGDIGKNIYIDLLNYGAKVSAIDKSMFKINDDIHVYSDIDAVPNVDTIIITSIKFEDEIRDICKQKYIDGETRILNINEWMDQFL